MGRKGPRWGYIASNKLTYIDFIITRSLINQNTFALINLQQYYTKHQSLVKSTSSINNRIQITPYCILLNPILNIRFGKCVYFESLLMLHPSWGWGGRSYWVISLFLLFLCDFRGVFWLKSRRWIGFECKYRRDDMMRESTFERFLVIVSI